MQHPLIQTLPPNLLDVIGDVHGEIDALNELLRHLGYDSAGYHPNDRKLVFVGDLCDRGPDSPAVIKLVQRMVEVGNAYAILGNHELNLLRGDAKDGSGWFFDERLERDERYQPFARPIEAQRNFIFDFLNTLPLVLEREDLRIVHAAWVDQDIDMLRQVRGVSANELFVQLEKTLTSTLKANGSYQKFQEAVTLHADSLEDENCNMPFLDAIADHDEACQKGNLVKVMTSGVERRAQAPFFSSHKWRFVERVGWWNEYAEAVPVLVGHYWRQLVPIDRAAVGKGDKNLFDEIGSVQWHGKLKNVFCLDYSVGGRWRERKDQRTPGTQFKLAAMRWPERQLVFDTGETMNTTGFLSNDLSDEIYAS
jgi:hypothetical protein